MRDEAGESRTEPFPCALTSRARPVVADHLAGGQRSVHSLLSRPEFVGVPVPRDWDATLWTNLNHPADLQSFLRTDGHSRTDARPPE